MGHVIQLVHNGCIRIFSGNQWEMLNDNWRTDRLRVFKLGGRVGHMTRHVWQLFKVKRLRPQGHAQDIYAVKNFSIGDTREYNNSTRLTILCPGLPWWAGTWKVKSIWILLKQETVSGSMNSWAICKPAPCSRQITTPAPQHIDYTVVCC